MSKIRNAGMRLLCLALSLVCLVSGIPGVAAEEETEAVAIAYIETCLVRNRAFGSASVIGQMEDGTVVTVLGESGDFYKIDCYDMSGYIAKSQIDVTEDGEYYVNCKEGSSETSSLRCESAADVLLLRAAVLELTRKQLGYPYVYGGSAPGGFDCSGLTSYVYKNNGYPIDRTASAQLKNGLIVAREGLQAGDLVFFRYDGSLASHVGIYVGDGQIIHAGSKGIGYAKLDGAWFSDYYLCARRIINVSSQTIDPVTAVVAESAEAYIPSIGIRTAH